MSGFRLPKNAESGMAGGKKVGPMTPNPDLQKASGAKGKVVKGTATPTKRG